MRSNLASGIVRAAVLLTAIAVLVGACGGSGGGQVAGGAGTPLEVVTSTTVLADLAQNVGGDLVHVQSLVPRNTDVHTFSPRPSDLAAIARAKLLILNGLGLDDWLDRTISNAAASGTPLVKLGEDLPGVTLLPGDAPNTQNPHLWMDVKYAELYVGRIADSLKRVAPDRAATFDANAAAYMTRLDGLDAWVRQETSTVPPANRKFVAFHDAFPYYAREYGIKIVGVAVEAPGQDPSAAYTARLIDAIRSSGVKAIFSENQFPTKLVGALASQTGTAVVSTLFDDALGDPPVTSYEALIRWDTQQLVSALGGAE